MVTREEEKKQRVKWEAIRKNMPQKMKLLCAMRSVKVPGTSLSGFNYDEWDKVWRENEISREQKDAARKQRNRFEQKIEELRGKYWKDKETAYLKKKEAKSQMAKKP